MDFYIKKLNQRQLESIHAILKDNDGPFFENICERLVKFNPAFNYNTIYIEYCYPYNLASDYAIGIIETMKKTSITLSQLCNILQQSGYHHLSDAIKVNVFL
jgi:hypothetical protein